MGYMMRDLDRKLTREIYNGKFIDLGETIECEFEQTQEIIDALQLEHGCCCDLMPRCEHWKGDI